MLMISEEFMSVIKSMESQIMEEVTGAQEYMACSDRWKSSSSPISTHYMEMAKQELDHAKKLNDMLPLIKGSEVFTDEQIIIVKFLMDMNSDQIRKVASK